MPIPREGSWSALVKCPLSDRSARSPGAESAFDHHYPLCQSLCRRQPLAELGTQGQSLPAPRGGRQSPTTTQRKFVQPDSRLRNDDGVTRLQFDVLGSVFALHYVFVV